MVEVLGAVAKLGHPMGDEQMGEAIRGLAVQSMGRMGGRELCGLGWALAAMGLMDEGAWEAFCGALVTVDGEC